MPLYTNGLLSGLQYELRAYLGARLIPIRLSKGSVLYAPGQPICDVYFIQKGIAALSWAKSESAVDVAMIGPEGMLGAGVSFGVENAVFRTFTRTDVIAAKLPRSEFEFLLAQSREFQNKIIQFGADLTAQIAETAYVNARLTVEQRVARWILLASKRLNTGVVRFTHDELSAAVGCRRAGVTVSLHMLEGEKIIRARRGQITILDPERLDLPDQTYTREQVSGRQSVYR